MKFYKYERDHANEVRKASNCVITPVKAGNAVIGYNVRRYRVRIAGMFKTTEEALKWIVSAYSPRLDTLLLREILKNAEYSIAVIMAEEDPAPFRCGKLAALCDIRDEIKKHFEQHEQ